MKKVITVCVLTYNQENFIGMCLDGILAQKGDFVLEVLIGEDGSSDNTGQICREYASKYPNIISLYQRSRNDVIYIDGRATGRYNFTETLLQAKGDYIALCEGDDYWTDPAKLEVLFQMLENDNKAVAAFHNVLYKDEVLNKSWPFHPNGWKYRSTTTDLCEKNFIATASVLFKKPECKLVFPDWYFRFRAGDWALHLLNSLRGDILYSNRIMGVYRHQYEGTWSVMPKKNQLVTIYNMYNILLSADEFLNFHKELNKGKARIAKELDKLEKEEIKSKSMLQKIRLLFWKKKSQ